MRISAMKMRRLALAFLSVLLAHSVNASDQAELRLEISGLAQAGGKVYYSVYDSPDTWLGDERVVGDVVDVEASLEGELVVATVELPPGEYAVSIFYDANGNGELDTNFIGIPKEPVALSNNAKAKFGPPKYKDAVFELPSEGRVQTIEIKEI